MAGWESGKQGTISNDLLSVVSQVMCMDTQWIPGRRGFLKYVQVMKKKIYGIWMKVVCFGGLYLIVDLDKREKNVRVVKKSKHRITVAFFVSASGVKEKPIVIWKSANPRCLKRFDKSALPVNYFSQKKAWMSGEIWRLF